MGLNLNGHLGSAFPCINSLDVTKDSLHGESVITCGRPMLVPFIA